MLCMCMIEGRAQVFEAGDEQRTVRTQGIWDNWFVQADLDMTLQNPYGYSMSEVFPNGKSFGLDLSIGKWFSHNLPLAAFDTSDIEKDCGFKPSVGFAEGTRMTMEWLKTQ